MRILILVGGTNEPSNADTLATAFMDGLCRDKNCQVEKLRVKDLNLEHFSLKFYESKTDQGEDFRHLQKAIEESSGIVIATPIWNFGVPAHVKNLIDRIGSFALDKSRSIGQLKGKPFFLIYTGGIPAAGWHGLQRKTTSHMVEAIKFFGGTVIGIHYEARCTKGRGIFGLVVDKRPKSLETMRTQGQKFSKIAQEYARTGKLPMKQALTHAFYQFGGRIKKMVGL